ncbi:MAG: tetratricopeptide repeat protein, partial [Chloroflexales bacterium]|nr:tetratricopeptide repeat protein [Chloroflexales bacterium]
MNSDDRTHNQRLLETHRAHMRDLEIKAAKYGELDVPSHITLELRDLRATIGEIEARLRAALPQHNLPPRDYERFVGRHKELAELRRLLGPRSRAFVVTVDGIGGIGKSALALETAYAFVDQYAALSEPERFKAIVWVSAKRSYLTATGILERRQAFRTLDDLFTAIAQVLDYPAITRARADERRALVEQALVEQRTLLIIDNLETVDDEDLLVFLRELPDPTKALVTTRHRIDVSYPVRLAGMSHEDALVLIEQEAERKGVALNADDQEALWQRTGGVPLALVWSIGLMGLGGSVESVLRRLGSGQSDIAQFCFNESVAYIRGRDAHVLLLALSFSILDMSREAVGVVAGLGDDEFGRDIGLEELLRLSLINKDGDRFSLLPLTRSYVAGEAAQREEWIPAARDRWYDFLIDLTTTPSRWSNHWEWRDQIERELNNIFLAIRQLLTEIQFVDTPEGYQIITPASIEQAKRLRKFVARCGNTCRHRGYWSDCIWLGDLEVRLSKQIDGHAHIGWATYMMGRVQYYWGNFAAARSLAYDALPAFEQATPPRPSWSYRLLGLIEMEEGNFTQAEELLQRALDVYQQVGGGESPQNFLESLAELAERRGDLAKAVTWYQQSLDTAREHDDLPYIAYSLLGLARVTQANGDMAAAAPYVADALQAARECRRTDAIARALFQLGSIAYASGQVAA